MLRIGIVIAFLLSLVTFAAPTAAQGTTVGPAIGESVPLYGSDAQPSGEVTITALVDPFEDYDLSSSAPPRGYHWVMAQVTFKAGETALAVNGSGGFQVIDSSGYATYQTYVYRSQDSTTANPDFSASSVEPGQSASGAIFFQLFSGETIAQITYGASYEQSQIVLDQRTAKVKSGDAVAYNSSEGDPIGELTVLGVVDPLTDFDPSSGPQRGFRYIGVAVRFKNTSDHALNVDPYRYTVADQEGFTATSSGAYRTEAGRASLPDFPYQELEAGQEVSGVVTFLMINGATIRDVTFAPTSDRQIRLAEFERDEVLTPPDVIVVPTVVVNPGCAAVDTWVTTLTAEFATTTPALNIVGQIQEGSPVASADVRNAADTLRSTASGLGDLDTPELAQAASDQLVSILNSTADAYDKLADAIDAKDDVAKQAALDAINAAFEGLGSGPYADLVTACPEISDL